MEREKMMLTKQIPTYIQQTSGRGGMLEWLRVKTDSFIPVNTLPDLSPLFFFLEIVLL